MFIFSGDKIIYLFTVSRALRDTQAAPVLCNHEFYLIIENQLSEDDSRQCSSLHVTSSRDINYVSVTNNSISNKTFLKSLEEGELPL